MTTKVNNRVKDKAKAKLDRLHKSSSYRSFFDAAAIDAFSKIEGSAFAGKSIKQTTTDNCCWATWAE